MREFSFATAYCMALMALFMFVPNSANAGDSTQNTVNPISYGWVAAARLYNLSSENDHKPYDLLSERQLQAAVSGLEQELQRDPDSLAAYVGLMQADPQRWQGETRRLTKPANLFKLGTLLFYQWGRQPIPTHPPIDNHLLVEAQAMLGQAWQSNHSPIIGLMLGDALTTGTFSNDVSLQKLNANKIDQQLIKDLAGPRAYAQYVIARKNGWKTKFPAVALIPAKNIRLLLAVVGNSASLSANRTGSLRTINGKPTMVDNPVPNVQVAEEKYLTEWYRSLKAVTNT